jgi:hypothetical protein
MRAKDGVGCQPDMWSAAVCATRSSCSIALPDWRPVTLYGTDERVLVSRSDCPSAAQAQDRSDAERSPWCQIASRMPGGRSTCRQTVRQPRPCGRRRGPQSRHGGAAAAELQDLSGKHRPIMRVALEGAVCPRGTVPAPNLVEGPMGKRSHYPQPAASERSRALSGGALQVRCRGLTRLSADIIATAANDPKRTAYRLTHRYSSTDSPHRPHDTKL